MASEGLKYVLNDKVNDHEKTDDEDSSNDSDSDDDNAVKDASDFIVGEEDLDDPTANDFIPQLKLYLHDLYKQRLINLKKYKIVKRGNSRNEASEVLINMCMGQAKVSIYDVVDLFELGASSNYQRKKKGDTALHWVAKRGLYDILWIFLQEELNTNVNIVDSRNCTALMYACNSSSSYQQKIVKDLLKIPNIKLNIRDSGGNTALLNAIYKNNVWVVRELLLHAHNISVLEKQEAEDPTP